MAAAAGTHCIDSADGLTERQKYTHARARARIFVITGLRWKYTNNIYRATVPVDVCVCVCVCVCACIILNITSPQAYSTKYDKVNGGKTVQCFIL